MAISKCVACGATSMFGPTFASDGGNVNNALGMSLIFDKNGDKEEFSVRRASACLDCGHIALYLSETDRYALRESVEVLKPIGED